MPKQINGMRKPGGKRAVKAAKAHRKQENARAKANRQKKEQS